MDHSILFPLLFFKFPLQKWKNGLVPSATWPSQLPRWLSDEESACRCRRHRRSGFTHQVKKSPFRRKWQPTPVLLPGKFHGQRSLTGYSPLDRKRIRHDWVTEHESAVYLPIFFLFHYRFIAVLKLWMPSPRRKSFIPWNTALICSSFPLWSYRSTDFQNHLGQYFSLISFSEIVLYIYDIVTFSSHSLHSFLESCDLQIIIFKILHTLDSIFLCYKISWVLTSASHHVTVIRIPHRIISLNTNPLLLYIFILPFWPGSLVWVFSFPFLHFGQG